LLLPKVGVRLAIAVTGLGVVEVVVDVVVVVVVLVSSMLMNGAGNSLAKF
jgi:hypothetical protein